MRTMLLASGLGVFLSAPATAQAQVRDVATSSLMGPQTVGLGLAAAGAPTSAAAGAAGGLASAASDAVQSRVLPAQFSPRKVCVFNFGVQVPGSARYARINNHTNARNIRAVCR